MAPHSKPLSDPNESYLHEECSELPRSASQQNVVEASASSPRPRASPSSSKIAISCAPWYLRVPPTISLPLLVMIDMFAVSLVVPLLFQYYKTAGVNQAGKRELISSLFTASQIVGGLLMGILTDAKLVKRRTILLLSFGGSAVSYALIAYGGLSALIFSRVLVGLVKQTMTVTTTMLTRHTTADNRARYMGRLSASSTVAWILGPSVGAVLYKYVDACAPPLVASALFAVNLVLASVLLREDDDGEQVAEAKKRRTSVWTSLKSCFTSRALGSIVVAKLIFTWVNKATNYSQLGSFFEDFYGLEPHQRGYISSFQQLLQFMVQAALVGPILNRVGGERRAICIFVAILALAVACEVRQSLSVFLFLICPIIALCLSMIVLSLQTLVTHVAPSSSIFSVLAALDVLQNAVSVSVPFYRTLLFRTLAPDDRAAMEGDPDPKSWVLVSSVHWAVAAFAMAYLLLSPAVSTKTKLHTD